MNVKVFFLIGGVAFSMKASHDYTEFRYPNQLLHERNTITSMKYYHDKMVSLYELYRAQLAKQERYKGQDKDRQTFYMRQTLETKQKFDALVVKLNAMHPEVQSRIIGDNCVLQNAIENYLCKILAKSGMSH